MLLEAAAIATAVGVLAAGCHQEGASAAAESPREVVSTADQDALWAVAPAEILDGVVVSARSTGMIEHAATEIVAAIAGAPDLAELHHQLSQGITEITGASGPLRLASFGLADRGAAFFEIDEHKFAAVVPVADRDVWLAKVHGTKGADGDTIGDAICRPLGARYVCASSPDVFAQLGHGSVPASLGGLGARGDIEVVARSSGGSETSPEVATVAQLDHGAVTVRGRVQHLPPKLIRMFGPAAAPHANPAAMAGFGVFDFTPVLAEMPPLPIVGDVTALDLTKSIAGPATYTIPAGTTTLDIRIPLTDPTPFRTVLSQCANLSALDDFKPTFSAGACHLTLPQAMAVIDEKVEGNTLRMGWPGTGAPVALSPTALGTLLADGKWSFAFYGRGSVFAADLSKLPMLKPLLSASSERDWAIAVRALAAVEEVAIGLRRDGTSIDFVLGTRTIWSNPDDVVKKLLAITPDQVNTGAATAAAQAIANASPASPFAVDLRAGQAGGLTLLVPPFALGGIAAPAFIDYLARAKRKKAQ